MEWKKSTLIPINIKTTEKNAQVVGQLLYYESWHGQEFGEGLDI